MSTDQDFLDWLQTQHAHAAGHRDGHRGDRIDVDLALAEAAYRHGLAEGRTQRIDEHLQQLLDQGLLEDLTPPPRSQAKKVHDYHLARDRAAHRRAVE